jgi:uncharacterized protein
MPPEAQNMPSAFHMLAKPTGAACNLDCKYCFFLSKEALYPDSPFRMSDEVLKAYIRQLLEGHRTPEVTVAWQGGEPTLMGLDFFRRSVALAEGYRRPDQRVSYSIQTNGTLLDDEWCAFFKEHNFLVGLSVDGPQALHDAYRVDKGGRGSFERVVRGWDCLQKHGVEVNVLCTVHAANADHPLEVYRFFRDELGAQFVQFIPIVERATEKTLSLADEGWGGGRGGERPLYTQSGDRVTGRSVRPEQYGQFLIAIFDEWVRRDVGKVYVQTFDVALGSWLGQHNLCIVSPTCGTALALEHNGDLYSCDHFVEPDCLLGNITERPMVEMVGGEQQRRFGQDKYDSLPRTCRECEVLFACYGGCPRNRFLPVLAPGIAPDSSAPDVDGGSATEGDLNYLCAGYKRFFKHIDPAMRTMANLLRQGRYADEIMQVYAAEDAAREESSYANVGRNDPCPCGSGKKFKHCHGRKAASLHTGSAEQTHS